MSQYTRLVAILIQSLEIETRMPSGKINAVLEIINAYAQWLSQYIRPVGILI